MSLNTPAIIKTRRKIWVASDPHLFHAGVLKFRGDDGELIRPGFSDVNEMNLHILEMWNSKVKPGDIGYLLGDIFMSDRPGFRALWPKFNGSKRLVIGNHDDPAFLCGGGFFKKSSSERKFGEYGLLFTHRPAHESGLFLNDQPLLNVHGHIHEKASPPGPFMNVSMEAIDYTPIEIEEIISHREALFGPWRDREGNHRTRSAS